MFLTDFHSHILPGIDDGAASEEVSLEQLRMSFEQGVRRIVATPHYYVYDESPDSFLARRDEAAARLKKALEKADFPVPEIYTGAEVYYDKNLLHSRDLRRLCIQGTRTVLIEMPFRRWNADELAALSRVQSELGLDTVVAHIERYFFFQTLQFRRELAKSGLIFQSNAEFFISNPHRAAGLIKKGFVNLLGTDTHGTDIRPPNLGSCAQLPVKQIPPGFAEECEACARELLAGAVKLN